MIAVLEGIDGVGKSTLACLLADLIGGIYYSTPPAKYRKERDLIDQYATPEEHFSFYRQALKCATDDIRKLLVLNRNVIIDRYWMSTYVYHKAMGVAVSKKDFGFCVDVDVTFYIKTNLEQRQSRIIARGVTNGDVRVSNIQELILSEYDLLINNDVNIVKIDNTFDTPDQTAEKILNILIERKLWTK